MWDWVSDVRVGEKGRRRVEVGEDNGGPLCVRVVGKVGEASTASWSERPPLFNRPSSALYARIYGLRKPQPGFI